MHAKTENHRETAPNQIKARQYMIHDMEKSAVTDPSSRAWVTWDGPDDCFNPRNWTTRRKWLVTLVASTFSFIAPLSSSMISPALPTIVVELHVDSGITTMMIVSIYVLGFALGPLYLGPLSELYGRKRVLEVSNILFLVFNTACGGCSTVPQLVIFRFLSGIGGSASLSAGGGMLTDLWDNEQRGKAMGIYTLMPLLGPALGPIIAGFIVKYAKSWRWCFYAVSIGGVLVQFVSGVLLKETYPRVILARKAERLHRETGDLKLTTKWEAEDQSLLQRMWQAFKRPIIMIATQPILQCIAVYQAFLYGLIYLVLSTFPRLWTEKYHQEVHIGGLNYVAVGFGFFVGAQVGTRLQDRIYMYLKQRNGGVGYPEFRIPLIWPGSLLVPIGIIIYAWTSEFTVFWLWPDVGIFILCASMILCFQCMQTYLVEAYTTYSASALAASTILRSLAGFGFPLFATDLYHNLGWGWGNSILAAVACVLGWPAGYMFWKYGKAMRKRSPFAAGEE
ncbi:MFS general substrate transporter [Periconia macrospinosa]|uniref:MFS general substrate transporter n=1 Tax=Periconia macrospinosa TaxID=97972 RepID=A0A2V1DM63_9PLEO|nr:MFS general substrate transporter [Periconia macrospinosa]